MPTVPAPRPEPRSCGRRLLLVALLVLACRETAEPVRAPVDVLDPCTLALVAPAGGSEGDLEIVRMQDELRQRGFSLPRLERLGWMFVARARRTFDPGDYVLAEQCALCLEVKHPGSPEALLLRGHSLVSRHRFREAEELARELVARRGLAADHGLLGDALMEQGRLEGAVAAYQRMVDLKPDLHSYSRVAHMRWLTGDLAGALEVMRMAVQASSSRDPEPAAWAYTRLALYLFQARDFAQALRACELALRLQPDYPPALLAKGRILLATGDAARATAALALAAARDPLPEHQWILAEALQAAGRTGEARAAEARVRERGALDDPRTFALFLATRGEQPERALKLVRKELAGREDTFTLDALAWSLAAAGRTAEAVGAMDRALAAGTRDARLLLHAGVIAAVAGETAEARRRLEQSKEIEQMLLPSEHRRLSAELAVLGRGERHHP